MKHRTRRQDMDVDNLAASFRERIYGDVTLMAVSLGLLTQPHISASHALAVITTTIFGLWLAAIFSSVMAHQLVHGKGMTRSELAHEVAISRGLLVSAGSAIFMLLIALSGLIDVRTALIVDIALSVIGLTFVILRSTKVTTSSFVASAALIVVQVAAAGLIIVTKLSTH